MHFVPSKTNMKKLRTVCLITCLTIMHFRADLNAQMTIRITGIPQYFMPLLDTIFIAGDFNSWNPGDTDYIMTKDIDGNYSIELAGAEGDLIEFKFTRGDWDRTETMSGGEFLPNRIDNIANGTTKDFTVANWQDQIGSHTITGNVIQLDYNFYMPQLDRYRRIWIYLPPDYFTSTNYYPVIYMNDGQNVFDYATSFAGEWDADGTVENLINNGHIPAIIVAIANGEGDRIDEYSPWTHPTYGGGDGDLYAKFITEDLKPYIDMNYRTLPDRENTVIGGSSLGGLISYYMVLEYDETFGKAIVFSPSFWFDDSVNIFAEDFIKEFDSKIYITSGLNEDVDMVPDINEVLAILTEEGFTEEEIISIVRGDGAHSEWFWKREFDEAYLWLFEDIVPLDLQTNVSETVMYYDFNNNMINITSPDNFNYIIYDLQGRLIEQNSISNNQITLQNYNPGIYFISLFNGKNKIINKIIIL